MFMASIILSRTVPQSEDMIVRASDTADEKEDSTMYRIVIATATSSRLGVLVPAQIQVKLVKKMQHSRPQFRGLHSRHGCRSSHVLTSLRGF